MIGIKGCFWKEGINGLGVRGFHNLPYKKRFDDAAREHDKSYDIQGDKYNRAVADTVFLINCLWSCNNDLQCFFAIFYFIMARLFGWMFFRYNNNDKKN